MMSIALEITHAVVVLAVAIETTTICRAQMQQQHPATHPISQVQLLDYSRYAPGQQLRMEAIPKRAGQLPAEFYVADTVLATGLIDTIRHAYGFDGNGKMTSDESERWSNGQWVPDKRSHYFNDSSGQQLGFLSEWYYEQWNNSSRGTYSYDARGNRLTSLTEYWSGGQWRSSDHYTYSYDTYGNQLSDLYEQYSDDQWVKVSRWTYGYDTNGYRQSVLFERWSDGQWVNSARDSYTYDANGNKLTFLSEVWYGSEWGSNLRSTYSYDVHGRVVGVFHEPCFNGHWGSPWRDTYSYDGSGSLVSYLREYYVGGQWVGTSRVTYTYDLLGNLTSGAIDSWSMVSSWKPATGSFQITDKGGNLYALISTSRILLHYRLIVTSISTQGGEVPIEYALAQNYPNPFNPTTTIPYALPHRSHVTLTVFSVLGQQVAELVDGEVEVGHHTVQFDGSKLASGMYLYQLRAGSQMLAKKLLLVK